MSDKVVPPDLTGAVDWVPPTPQEQFPTRSRYFVRYDGGLVLEVVATAGSGVATEESFPGDSLSDRSYRGPGALTRLRHWLADRLFVLFSGGNHHVKVRIVLPVDEAGNLYRSLPDSSSLLIVSPAPRRAPAQQG